MALEIIPIHKENVLSNELINKIFFFLCIIQNVRIMYNILNVVS